MSAQLQLFFNGTGLMLPFNKIETLETFREKCLKGGAENDSEEMLEELEVIEEALNDYEKEKGIRGKVVNQMKMLDKIFEGEGHTALEMWCVNIFTLIDRGVLKEDDNTGIFGYGTLGSTVVFVYNMSCIKSLKKITADKIQERFAAQRQEQKLCGYCGNPNPAKKCGKCYVKYCSKDCQIGDWKKHKKECEFTNLKSSNPKSI
jgi:hypothetical protein